MKKFERHRSVPEIRELCERDGVTLQDQRFMLGSDFVRLEGGGAWVMYNTFNGQFWGETPDGVKFGSQKTTHDSEPWFQALLSFLYVEKAA